MAHLISFSVEADAEVKTIRELNDAFYPLVTLLKKEMKKRYKKAVFARIQHPQKLLLNPPGYGDSESVVHGDVYVAIYYRGYHVRIEQGDSIFGPHKLELLYQVCKGRRVWLGTHTAKFNFFSDKEVRHALKLAIRDRDYFCSAKSGEEIVEMTEDEIEPPIQIDHAAQSRTTIEEIPKSYARTFNEDPIFPLSSFGPEDFRDIEEYERDVARSEELERRNEKKHKRVCNNCKTDKQTNKRIKKRSKIHSRQHKKIHKRTKGSNH